MSAVRAGIRRVLDKCQSCVDAGNYYEAHQMYKTLYFRYNSQKRYEDAMGLLYSGSMTLLKHQQYSSGVDLAILLIDAMTSAHVPVTDESIEKTTTLFEMTDPDCSERQQYLTATVNWSMKVDSRFKSGHPNLHKKFGFIFWNEKNYAQSRYHFLHSSDGENCAALLIEHHTLKGYSSEVDLFIAQAVLQFLCLQNKDTAYLVFVTYTKQHPAIRTEPPFLRPLLNFIWFLLLALDGGKVSVFLVLCEKYETSINRDPTYKEYLDRIGQLFFGLPPPNSSPQGFIGNILQSLFGPEQDKAEEQLPSSSFAAGVKSEELD